MPNLKHVCYVFILISLIVSIDALSGRESDTDFRFAVLSDLHVSENDSSEADLKAAVADINQLSGIDFVLVSGDITEADLGDNLVRAKHALDKLRVPYYIIPGNHDTKWTDSAGRRFLQLWGKDTFTFTFGNYRFIGFHQGPEVRMAEGFIAPQHLHWLDSLLTALPDPQQPLIFVTHYGADQSVANIRRFFEIIDGYNVTLLIHGHGHSNRVSDYNGIPGVMVRSTLRAGRETGGYNIVTVRNDSIYFRERLTAQTSEPVWYKQSLRQPTFTYTPPETNEQDSINQHYPAVKRRWLFDCGNLMAAAPVIDDERIFIGDAGGRMHALYLESGELIWQYQSDGRIYATAAAANGRVVFTSADSNIYCLNAENGKPIWNVKTGAPNLAVPLIDNGTVYVGGSDGRFRALDLQTGRKRWLYDGINGYIESKPLLYDDNVYITAWDEHLYAFDQTNGSLVWKWNAGRPGLLYSPAACWPAAANGAIFIVAPDRVMSAIDAETGQTLWRSDRFMVRESIGLSEDGKHVYARCMRDTVIAVAADPQQYRLEWAADAAFDYDLAPSMPVEKDGRLFVAAMDGLILALNPHNGRVIWQHKFEDNLIHTPAAIDNHAVIISNMNGKVLRLDAEGL